MKSSLMNGLNTPKHIRHPWLFGGIYPILGIERFWRVLSLLVILLVFPLDSGFSQVEKPEVPIEEQVGDLKLKIFKDPSDVISQVELGRLYGKMKKYTEAQKAFHDALQYDPQNARAHFYLGAIFLKTQDDPDGRKKAVAEYQVLTKLDPELAGKLKEMLPIGALDSAEVQVIKQQMSSATTNLSTQILLARAYAKAGQSAEALALLNKLAQENPRSSEAFRELGKFQLSAGMAVLAREAYVKGMACDPGFETRFCVREKLSVILDILSSDTEKISGQKGLPVGHISSNPAILGNLVGRFRASLKEAVLNDLMLTDAGELKKASGIFSEGLRVSLEACMTTLQEMGNALRKTQKWAEARPMFQKLVDAGVGMPDTLLSLGLIQEALGQFPEAIASFKDVIRRKGDLALANLHLALTYSKAKLDKEAIIIFSTIVQDGNLPALMPVPEANLHLGKVFLLRKNWASASAFLEEAIRQNPDAGPAFFLLGFVRVEEGDADKALPLFLNGSHLASFPTDLMFPRGYQVLGDSFFRVGKYAEAEKALTKALMLKADPLEILPKLGQALSQQGKHQDAVEIFARELRENPKAPLPVASASLFDFAAAAGLNGQDQRAEEILEKMLPGIKKIEFSEHRKVNIVLSKVLRKLGREAEAMQALNHSGSEAPAGLDKKEGFENLYHQGVAFCLQKREIEATSAFKGALEISSELPPNDSPDVWTCLGRIFQEKGQSLKALKCYQEVLKLSPGQLAAREGAMLMTALLGDEKACAEHLGAIRKQNSRRAGELIRELDEMPALNDGKPFWDETDADGKLSGQETLPGFSGIRKTLEHSDFDKEVDEKPAPDKKP